MPDRSLVPRYHTREAPDAATHPRPADEPPDNGPATSAVTEESWAWPISPCLSCRRSKSAAARGRSSARRPVGGDPHGLDRDRTPGVPPLPASGWLGGREVQPDECHASRSSLRRFRAVGTRSYSRSIGRPATPPQSSSRNGRDRRRRAPQPARSPTTAVDAARRCQTPPDALGHRAVGCVSYPKERAGAEKLHHRQPGRSWQARRGWKRYPDTAHPSLEIHTDRHGLAAAPGHRPFHRRRG
jgi:hypothetical protein